MISPLSRLVAALALVLAACGGAATTSSTPTDAAGNTSPASAEEAGEVPQAIPLSYSLEPGASFTYEIQLIQDMVMTSSGDPSAMDGEQPPGDADLRIEATATFTYDVSAGPEPGTYAVTITGEFGNVEVTGTVDSEPVAPGDVPEFAALEPVETTIIVDEKGNVIPDVDGGEDLLGGMDFLSGGSMPGTETASFFGPPLPDGEVTVGDTWTETTETPMPFGEEPVITTVEGRVVGTDQVDGVEVFVIEATTSTSEVRFDLGEFFAGFFEAFLPEDATDEEKAEMEALTEAMKFLFAMDPSTSTSTSWLDPDTGIVRRAEAATSIRFTMDIAMPDEETNELVEFGMEMTLDQEMTLRYLDSTGA